MENEDLDLLFMELGAQYYRIMQLQFQLEREEAAFKRTLEAIDNKIKGKPDGKNMDTDK